MSGKETKEALEGVFRMIGWPGTLVTDGGSAFKNKEVSELLEGEDVEHQVCTYDQGMGNRGEVFMTWEGFEPGTWSLELWDLKRFELGTL